MNERPAAANIALGLLAAVLALSAAVWTGAEMAARVFGAGHWLDVGLGDSARAFLRLGDHVGDPRRAWPLPYRRLLPGPVPYWVCTLAVFSVLAIVVIPVLTLLRHRGTGSQRRRQSRRRPARTLRAPFRDCDARRFGSHAGTSRTRTRRPPARRHGGPTTKQLAPVRLRRASR